jgi:hypothetical protein
LDIFDSRPPELVEPLSTSAAHVVQSWRQVAGANDLVAKVAKALDPPVSGTQPKTQTRLDALRSLIGAERIPARETIPGVSRYFQALDRWVELLEQKVHDSKERQVIEEAIRAASNLLTSARGQETEEECLRMLNSEPLNSVRDPVLQVDVNRLRKEIQYRLSCRQILEKKPRVAADREILKVYDDFLQLHPKAPTAKEGRAHEMVLQRRAKLHFEVAMEDLTHVSELENLLAGAFDLLREASGDQGAKVRVRSQVKNWLRVTGLPETQLPECLLGREEAVTKNGRRLIGYFYLPDGPKGLVQWRYWASSEGRKPRPRGDEQIAQEDFAESPAEPRYVRLARESNDLRQKLIRANGSKAEWQSGGTDLQRMQKDLTAYRERWGHEEEADKSCRDWTFEPQIEYIRQIIHDWDRFRELCED